MRGVVLSVSGSQSWTLSLPPLTRVTALQSKISSYFRVQEELSATPLMRRMLGVKFSFCGVKCKNRKSGGVLPNLATKSTSTERRHMGYHCRAASTPLRGDGMDMEVLATFKRGRQRASQAVRRVGGVERDVEKHSL